MNTFRHPIVARGLSYMEKHELFMGRAQWGLADYRAAGGLEFDRIFTASRTPTKAERDHYIRAFVDLNCPPAKRVAAHPAAHFNREEASA